MAERSRRPPLSLALRVYILLLAIMVAAFVPKGLELAIRRPWETLAWIAFIAITNFRSIPMLPRADIDTTFAAPPSVAASVLLPLPLAVLVSLVGKVTEREFRPDTSGWAIVLNRAQGALMTGAGAFVAQLVFASSGQSRLVNLTLATVAAGVVYDLVNVTVLGLSFRFRGRRFREAARVVITPYPSYFTLNLALIIGLGLVIVVLYDQVAPGAVLFLAVPLWLGYTVLLSARENQERAEELAARVRELEALNGLGTDLLTTRRQEQAEGIAEAALCTALETQDVVVSLAGIVPDGLRLTKVPGADGAAIGVPDSIDEQSMEMVDAVAALLGLALKRLDVEAELGEVERARTNLAGKLIEEGTHERSRVALKIHDEVLPYLAAAEIQADNVRSALGEQEQCRADRLAAATREAVRGGINQLRQVLDSLTGQIVVPGGLRDALEKSLIELRLEHGVDGRLNAPDPMPGLPLAFEILVAEVVRGCLSNVARHAQAHNVLVQLDVTDTLLVVQVEDDGRGFNPMDVPAGHHGLALMQQRIELARGRFRVRSAEGGGTRVEVEVPL